MSGRIRVAVAGVGNCASSLVQGVEYYRNADAAEDVPGLMHVVLGRSPAGAGVFVAAFGGGAPRVGLVFGRAISAGQNTPTRSATGGELGAEVHRAPPSAAPGKSPRERAGDPPAAPVDIAQ